MAFVELAGSPKYSGTKDSLSATRVGYIPWGDINSFYASLFPAPIGGYPALPGLLPGSSGLYADSVDFEPFIGDEDVAECVDLINAYDYAKVTIQYKTQPYEQSGTPGSPSGQIITRRWSTSGDVLVLPSCSLKWDADGKAILDPDVRAGQVIPMQDIVIQLHRVTASYFNSLRATVDSMIGDVNDAMFEGYPQETLMLQGMDSTQTVSVGSISYECEVKFQYRKVLDVFGQVAGWNHFYRPDASAWERVTKMNGDNIFRPSDFTQLYS